MRTSKTIAVVQARMGASRLPGKMLRLLAGRPLIDYALARLTQALQPNGPLDGVVLATSVGSDNDPLVAHVQERWPDVIVVRGPEDDVLARFLEAIRLTAAQWIVRATGDCPLINLNAMAAMLNALHAKNADIVNYEPGYEYVDKGLEAIRADALTRAAVDTSLQPHDREHVTSLLYREPEHYRVFYVPSEPFLRRGDIRITVDTEADLAFLEALAGQMGKAVETVNLQEVVATVDAHPELLALNATAGRKSTLHERARLGFRCDGGTDMGMGHVVGCVRMAQLAARELGCGIEFVVRENPVVIKTIKQAGFAVEVLPLDTPVDADIERMVAKSRQSDWRAVVVNLCKDDLDRYAEHWGPIKDSGLPLIFMDNPVPPSYLLGDLVINALPHPDYKGYDPDSHPNCVDGLAYFLIATAANPLPRQPRVVNPDVRRVLVAMGGGDGENTTALVLEALVLAGFQGYVDVVLGAANPNLGVIREQFTQLGLQGDVRQGVADLPDRMVLADIGFSALGLTTYEMAYYGLPVLLIAGHAFNGQVADGYAHRYGGAQYLGLRKELNAQTVADAFMRLAGDADQRNVMARTQEATVDGRGAERVCELLKLFLR